MENGNFENFLLSYSSFFFKTDIECELKDNYSSGFINGAILAHNNQNIQDVTIIVLREPTNQHREFSSINKQSISIYNMMLLCLRIYDGKAATDKVQQNYVTACIFLQ